MQDMGDDVGEVGPNKEYEKVINLEVAKYLDNILKQKRLQGIFD